MHWRLTILNVPIVIYLLFLLVFTIINYDVLSGSGGWGIVGMVGVSSFIATGLIVDLIIHNVIKSKQLQFYLRLIALAVYTFLLIAFFNS